MNKEFLERLFLFHKPEVEILRNGRFAICCEIDMFNSHILYFVREYTLNENGSLNEDNCCDYWYRSDYKDVIDEFLEKINNEEKR